MWLPQAGRDAPVRVKFDTEEQTRDHWISRAIDFPLIGEGVGM